MALASQPEPVDSLASRLAQLGRSLEGRFLGKEEVIRLLLVAVVAGEHAVLIGPPGTAKSALVRTFARLMHARYFEYLLTRFPETTSSRETQNNLRVSTGIVLHF